MKTHRYTFPAPVMASHTAVVGKTGAGKTITAKDLVEQAHAEGANICILDPIKSDWWGVTLDASGKGPGLPFHILGGPVGHVDLHADAGDAIGRIVANGALRHSIFDMADFGPGEHNEFYNAFAEALFRNKTKKSGTLYLVLEEAHVFCPKERDGVKGENMAVFWTKRIATAARSKGVRIIATTQRTQALHNAVLGSCETVIAHRLTFPADQKPVLDWLKASAPAAVVKEVAESLASLKTGEGWLCSGEAQVFERVKFPMIQTFDNSSAPDDGSAHDAVRPPPVDQAALRAIVGEAVKEAEANDPKKLRERIEELEGDLAAAKAAEGDVTADGEEANRLRHELDDSIHRCADFQRRAADAEARLAGNARTINELANELQARADDLRQVARGLAREARGAAADDPATTLRDQDARPLEHRFRAGIEREARASARLDGDTVEIKPKAVSNGSLNSSQTKVLTAIAQHPRGVSRVQLSALAGYARSTRDRLLQELGRLGMITDGEAIQATPEGRKALGPSFKPLPTGSRLRQHWVEKLPEGNRKVFVAVCDVYPKGIAREALDAVTGYARSTRDRLIQELERRKLVTTERGQVRASDTLFDR